MAVETIIMLNFIVSRSEGNMNKVGILFESILTVVRNSEYSK